MQTLKMAIVVSMIMVSAAFAGNFVLDGKTYGIDGCSVTFQQGPFGPGETGMATVDCVGKVSEAAYSFSDPLLDVAGSRFVLVGPSLYYLDPDGLVLIEQ